MDHGHDGMQQFLLPLQIGGFVDAVEQNVEHEQPQMGRGRKRRHARLRRRGQGGRRGRQRGRQRGSQRGRQRGRQRCRGLSGSFVGLAMWVVGVLLLPHGTHGTMDQGQRMGLPGQSSGETISLAALDRHRPGHLCVCVVDDLPRIHVRQPQRNGVGRKPTTTVPTVSSNPTRGTIAAIATIATTPTSTASTAVDDQRRVAVHPGDLGHVDGIQKVVVEQIVFDPDPAPTIPLVRPRTNARTGGIGATVDAVQTDVQRHARDAAGSCVDTPQSGSSDRWFQTIVKRAGRGLGTVGGQGSVQGHAVGSTGGTEGYDGVAVGGRGDNAAAAATAGDACRRGGGGGGGGGSGAERRGRHRTERALARGGGHRGVVRSIGCSGRGTTHGELYMGWRMFRGGTKLGGEESPMV